MSIAFAGEKSVGKTTAVSYLIERGYENINFADPIKQSLQNLLDLSDEQLYGNLKEVVDTRYNLTPRQLMQQYSDHMKNFLGERIFVQLLMQKLSVRYKFSCAEPFGWEPKKLIEKKYVVGDLRYPYEAEAFKKHGIVVIIERDTVKNEYSLHSSETSINSIIRDEKVFVISNNGSLQDLHQKIDEVVEASYMLI